MFMNLNTGICNIKKGLKQYNQERSILLFFIQRSTYSNASVESYNFVFNFFNVLEAQSHTPRNIQCSRYTAYMIFYPCSMQCFFCTEKRGEKRQQRLSGLTSHQSAQAFCFTVFLSIVFTTGKNHHTLIMWNDLNINELKFRGMAMAPMFPI